MSSTSTTTGHAETRTASSSAAEACVNLPDLVRLNYFHGQLLGPGDFQREQDYFRDKLRLMNRCLHGYGVICGLDVIAMPGEQRCKPADEQAVRELDEKIAAAQAEIARLKAAGDNQTKLDELQAELEELRRKREGMLQPAAHDGPAPARMQVTCGFALDCHGNEIVVRNARVVDVLELLSADERARLQQEDCVIAWLSICSQECGFQATRPVSLDECAVSTGCQNARVREGWKLRASLEKPDEDQRCEHCCTACEDCCVLLAAVKLRRAMSPQAADVDTGVRRRFGLYESTVITGINWQHGATYSWQDAAQILGREQGSGGIEIRFSREVRADTLKPGVIDIWRLQGGRGLAGVMQHIEGEYVDLPASGYVDRVRFRDTTGERLQDGDRILIIVRGSFILDRCCKPVESAHVGGKVPLIPESAGAAATKKPEYGKAAERARRREDARRSEDPKHQQQHGQPEQPHGDPPEPAPPQSCPRPLGYGPWTTGPGQTFESWFFIAG